MVFDPSSAPCVRVTLSMALSPASSGVRACPSAAGSPGQEALQPSSGSCTDPAPRAAQASARPAAPWVDAGQGGVPTRLEAPPEECVDLPFAGRPVEPHLARGIAYGYLHPEPPHAPFGDMVPAVPAATVCLQARLQPRCEAGCGTSGVRPLVPPSQHAHATPAHGLLGGWLLPPPLARWRDCLPRLTCTQPLPRHHVLQGGGAWLTAGGRQPTPAFQPSIVVPRTLAATPAPPAPPRALFHALPRHAPAPGCSTRCCEGHDAQEASCACWLRHASCPALHAAGEGTRLSSTRGGGQLCRLQVPGGGQLSAWEHPPAGAPHALGRAAVRCGRAPNPSATCRSSPSVAGVLCWPDRRTVSRPQHKDPTCGEAAWSCRHPGGVRKRASSQAQAGLAAQRVCAPEQGVRQPH